MEVNIEKLDFHNYKKYRFFERSVISGMISKKVKILHGGSCNFLTLSKIMQNPFENRNFSKFCSYP